MGHDLTRHQYVALLFEIVEHRAELDADGGLEPLAEQAFVRNRAGNYARPSDCYYWSADLANLLGDDGNHWVEEGWMPTGRAASRFKDLLEGMGSDPSEAKQRVGDDNDVSDAIDVAAIAAVLKYETSRGWSPEEQPHSNPGYDIVSNSTDGRSRRLIEVKGLENDWTERGIKLSGVQYQMAEDHPEEFWIYVVENARDLDRQRVSAIANPFAKVEEYWFDDRWRRVCEESATAREVNIRIGARIKHDTWGIGTIVLVKRLGMAHFLTVDFGKIEGCRGIPYTSNLKFVD